MRKNNRRACFILKTTIACYFSIAPLLPCNNNHLLLVLGLGPVPVPVVFHCPWPHLSSNSHKPSMHLPDPTGTSKWIQTWTHTEALDFFRLPGNGLMCPCSKKPPTTFTSQPFKSLWLLLVHGHNVAAGAGDPGCIHLYHHDTTYFPQLGGSKSNAVLDGQAFTFYGNLFISWHK